MRTHAHGQGWADPNFVIPELVERIDFFKGPYFPAIGDFSGAGAAEFRFYKTLPRDIVTAEYGENDYYRGLIAQSLVLRSDGEANPATPPQRRDTVTRARQILSTIREDDVLESSAGLYAQAEVFWTRWFRSIVGLRGDGYYFDVDNHVDPGSSGATTAGIVSPKLSLILGPFAKTEIYLSAGSGFHSNDARGVIGGIDPATGEASPPADALVPSRGGELGVRTSFVPGLVSSVAFFYLQSDSELVFVGDAGAVEPSGASERYGIEFNNFYRPVEWLTLDADVALARGRFTDAGAEGDKIPGAIPLSLATGVSLDLPSGIFASLRGRYFSSRPLTEDGSVESRDSLIFNARIGYRFKNPEVEIAVQVLNVFNARDNDIEYRYRHGYLENLQKA
ncbi:MAG TPA: TonB-dependent receptor [Chthoniobacterales bacterium]|nr:TonB-dependent receptor [Chthoniobacterales bacterium]